ncbi:hypothetical protein [Glycomyces rhizosphaerae]|uniref:Uncharacterized protein n=1 Tax=Glycomyces rhizosphaerae TaxID=2054422 RepID=A0ABV7Q0U3_9ACTN
MGSALTVSPDPADPQSLRSDGEPASIGYLGEFRRGHVLFVVYAIPLDQGRYPNRPAHFLIDCFDPVGPGEVCRFTIDPTDTPDWRGSWRGDEWCPWILERARALIADPGS